MAYFFMAKELPYFKFEPNLWVTGNVQLLNNSDKGLFIEICCMYWSRLGDLSEKLVIMKLCGGNANALQTLYDANVIESFEGQLFISFLENQLASFQEKSKTNSKTAKEAWEKRRAAKALSERIANEMRTHSEGNAIRGEEIKEDKIIKKFLVDKKSTTKAKTDSAKFFIECKELYFKFVKTKYNIEPIFTSKDGIALSKLLNTLEKRAIDKNPSVNYDLEFCLKTFTYVLNTAYQVEFIKNNFTIPILISQFNQILIQSTKNN